MYHIFNCFQIFPIYRFEGKKSLFHFFTSSSFVILYQRNQCRQGEKESVTQYEPVAWEVCQQTSWWQSSLTDIFSEKRRRRRTEKYQFRVFFCVELSWTKKEYFYFSVIFEKTRNVNCVSVRLSHKLHPPALIQGIFIFVPNRATPLGNILFQFSTWLPVHATPPLTSCSRPSAHSKKKINSIVKGFFFAGNSFFFGDSVTNQLVHLVRHNRIK